MYRAGACGSATAAIGSNPGLAVTLKSTAAPGCTTIRAPNPTASPTVTSGTAVVPGSAGFATRNSSLVQAITTLGGGTLVLTSPANSETVQAPFTGPHAVAAITILAGEGTSNPGTGALILKDAAGIGAGVVFDRGTLAQAEPGRLLLMLDVNFMDSNADPENQALLENLIAFSL